MVAGMRARLSVGLLPALAIVVGALGLVVAAVPAYQAARAGTDGHPAARTSHAVHQSAHMLYAPVTGDTGVAPTSQTMAQGLQNLAPVRLIIPKLGLDAPILGLGPDATGGMQAPVYGGPDNPIYRMVYWWDVGALPGQVGNAVIAGHINRPDGSPGVFGNLNQLLRGDTIEVVTAGGKTLTFVVTGKDAPLVYVHGSNDPTIGRIFGPSLTPQLNLLTCWGRWDGKEYSRRLFIASTLVGPSPFPAQSGATSHG